ncbi:MAG: exodeoxyribonuclease VII small subunit [Candidatus Dormibacteria bacterium]
MEAEQSPAAVETLDYEAALAALDTVLEQLEDGRVALEEAMALYERGVSLVRRCSGLLDGAEKRVQELSQSPGGQLLTQPLLLAEDEEEEPGAGPF